jgi:peroxiredoxin
MFRSIAVSLACSVLTAAVSAGPISGVAPDFTLQTQSGESRSLAEHKGDVVMINFWATWCAPCRQEMPYLEALYQRYGALGFTLLGVNVEKDPVGATEWLAETPVSFPILFDPENEVSELYDVIAMPNTVLIDRQGNLRYLHHGYKPGYENEYQTQIRALIRE